MSVLSTWAGRLGLLEREGIHQRIQAGSQIRCSHFKIYPESNHFFVSSLQTLIQTAFVSRSLQQPPNCFLCFQSCPQHPHFLLIARGNCLKYVRAILCSKLWGLSISLTGNGLALATLAKSISYQCPCSLVCLSWAIATASSFSAPSLVLL